jgi:hypothetical protein
MLAYDAWVVSAQHRAMRFASRGADGERLGCYPSADLLGRARQAVVDVPAVVGAVIALARHAHRSEPALLGRHRFGPAYPPSSRRPPPPATRWTARVAPPFRRRDLRLGSVPRAPADSRCRWEVELSGPPVLHVGPQLGQEPRCDVHVCHWALARHENTHCVHSNTNQVWIRRCSRVLI